MNTMKLILLDGAPTMGKSSLGEIIVEQLQKEYPEKKIFHFNDDIANKYDINTIQPLKQDDKSQITLNNVTTYLNGILDKLENMDQDKKHIYVIDRFHFSYLKHLDTKVSHFTEIEKRLENTAYYILLSYTNPTKESIYNRYKQSLGLRDKNHGFNSYFAKISADTKLGSTPEERTLQYFNSRDAIYKQALAETRIKNKALVAVDDIIRKEDYSKAYKQIENQLKSFVEQT